MQEHASRKKEGLHQCLNVASVARCSIKKTYQIPNLMLDTLVYVLRFLNRQDRKYMAVPHQRSTTTPCKMHKKITNNFAALIELVNKALGFLVILKKKKET